MDMFPLNVTIAVNAVALMIALGSIAHQLARIAKALEGRSLSERKEDGQR